jgi:lambda family phage minor tail protein L
MKNFQTTIVDSAKNQLENSAPFIWLVSVKIPSDPPTRFRATNYHAQVERGTSTAGDPLVYYPFPIAFGDHRQSQSGDLPTSTINVANVSLELMTTLHTYKGLVGQEIVVRWVRADALEDPGAEYKFVGQITSCVVDDRVASFTFGTRNLQQAPFPRNRWVANHCQWRFGTAECGYKIVTGGTNTVGGGFTFCPRTLTACEERGDDETARSLTSQHPLRFGGYPGIQRGNQ